LGALLSEDDELPELPDDEVPDDEELPEEVNEDEELELYCLTGLFRGYWLGNKWVPVFSVCFGDEIVTSACAYHHVGDCYLSDDDYST
jgi:hypothetical protein